MHMQEKDLLKMLDQLCALPHEAATVEFKSNWAKPEDIGEYLSALGNAAVLNGHKSAWMVWGVDDTTHTIKGTDFNPSTAKGEGNQALIMWLTQKITPRPDFEFHVVTHPSGRVVMLEIHPPLVSPLAFAGVRYIRIGSHTTRLADHRDKEVRLWQLLGGTQDWTAQIVTEASLDDLDPDAIAKARLEFTEKFPGKGKEVQGWDDETFLNKARLTIHGRITRTALLLLGREESAALLAPADVRITWVLKDESNRERDYEHFGPPFILSAQKALGKIRNLTLRELPSGTLFPVELLQYDSWVLREGLHNCIAHQDYSMGARINVVEFPDRLLFTNSGAFLPGSVEQVILQDAPPDVYRNPFLASAMVNLNMIDTQGGGIKRMFAQQAKRFFPLPDYDLGTPGRVSVTVRGTIMDERYSQLLMKRTDMDLALIMLLDKVQKSVHINKDDAARLKKLGLAEGRYPRLIVSGKVAAVTGGQAQHIRKRGFDNRYYRDLLVDLIRAHGPIGPNVITELFMEKLPDSLTTEQKRTKIRNLTFDLSHRKGSIENVGTERGAGALWQIKGSRQTNRDKK